MDGYKSGLAPANLANLQNVLHIIIISGCGKYIVMSYINFQM